MELLQQFHHSTAVLCRDLEKNGMVRAWHGHEHCMARVNQTRPHCVDQMGKTHYKPLAARHGRGTACYVWISLKCSTSFYGLNFSPICQIHIRNFVLMFYLYVNKCWLKTAFCRIFSPPHSNRQCSLFSKKNPIIRIFYISGRLAVPINPDKWSSTVPHI